MRVFSRTLTAAGVSKRGGSYWIRTRTTILSRDLYSERRCGTIRRIRIHLGIIGAYAALAIGVTYPLVLHLGTHVPMPSYLHAERVCFLTPLNDQIAAGAEMWVLNSVVFLVPAVVLTFRLLAPRSLHALSPS